MSFSIHFLCIVGFFGRTAESFLLVRFLSHSSTSSSRGFLGLGSAGTSTKYASFSLRTCSARPGIKILRNGVSHRKASSSARSVGMGQLAIFSLFQRGPESLQGALEPQKFQVVSHYHRFMSRQVYWSKYDSREVFLM